MTNIYQLVFGTDGGQVCCVFHADNKASAGISSIGQYNCFTCGAKAHDEVGFIAKYFSVGLTRAKDIQNSLAITTKLNYSYLPLIDEQTKFLQSIGLTDAIIAKYFFCSKAGKLIYKHTWNGVVTGYTWFNSPSLSNYNASALKYKYDRSNIGGMVTPYDDVINFKNLLVCEGEKDMLTAKSFGFPNAVAKIGGAKSYIIAGLNFENKNVVLCYDCDDAGRDGMIQDATLLTTRFNCKVKTIDLNLAHGEDLNDYFMKHKKTKSDLLNLIQATPVFIPEPVTSVSRLSKFVDNLSATELVELEKLIKLKKENN